MTDLLSSIPLHPMLVHFPIALYFAAMVLEILSLLLKRRSLHESAKTIFVFAAFMAPLVVWAGLAEQKRLGIHHPVMEAHQRFGFITMWAGLAGVLILTALNFFKRKYPAWLFLVMAILLTGLVSCTAYYGGRLVYEYAVGVASP